jgi:hypothetical protein
VKTVDNDWVAAAVARAEPRLGDKMPSFGQAYRTTPATQLGKLIGAIANPSISCPRLRRLAEVVKEGTAS